MCVSLLEGILRLSEGCEGCAGSVHIAFAIIVIIEKVFGREPSQPSEFPQYSVFSCKWEIWGDGWGTIKEPSEPSLLSGGAGIQALI